MLPSVREHHQRTPGTPTVDVARQLRRGARRRGAGLGGVDRCARVVQGVKCGRRPAPRRRRADRARQRTVRAWLGSRSEAQPRPHTDRRTKGNTPMQGLMQDYPLTLPHIFHRAERLFPDKEIVTALPTGRERITYGEWAERTRRLGGVLDDLGISRRRPGGHLRLEHRPPPRAVLRRAVHRPGAAHAQHPAVPRAGHLHREPRRGRGDLRRQVARRAAVAAAATFETVRHIVVIDDGGPFDTSEVPDGMQVHDYEELLAARRAGRVPRRRTRTRPHRCATRAAPPATPRASSTATARRSCTPWRPCSPTASAPASPTASCRSCPCSTPTPGAWPTPRSPAAPTWSCPGPTSAADAARRPHRGASGSPWPPACPPSGWACCPRSKGRDTSALRAIPCGGSAVPKALSEAFREQLGLPILQAWGMTETSPVATVGAHQDHAAPHLPEEELADLRAMQGLPAVRRRAAGAGRRRTAPSVPWDGESRGELQAAGPVDRPEYYNDDRSPESFTDDGWLRTGDVATIDRRRLHPLVDRTKDVVKSRRRVDQLGRARERDHGPPQGGRGRRHRRAPPEVAGAPAGLRGGQGGRGAHQGRGPRVPRRPRRQVVAPRRRRLHRRGPQDQRRQVLQEGPARQFKGLHHSPRRRNPFGATVAPVATARAVRRRTDRPRHRSTAPGGVAIGDRPDHRDADDSGSRRSRSSTSSGSPTRRGPAPRSSNWW